MKTYCSIIEMVLDDDGDDDDDSDRLSNLQSFLLFSTPNKMNKTICDCVKEDSELERNSVKTINIKE